MKMIAILMAASLVAGASAQSLRGESFGAPRTLQPQPYDAWMRQAEVTGDVMFHMPGLGDFDVFDIAYGFEAGYRMWLTDIFGLGFGVGFEQWSADTGFSRNWGGAVAGDMRVIPLSVTGYLRVLDMGWGVLNGFLGLEYAVIDSDLTLIRDSRLETVSVDDTFGVRFGGELAMPITDVLSVGLQAGMQDMFSKGSAKGSGGGRLMDVTLQSAFFGVGLSMAF